MNTVISTPNAPAPGGHYSQAMQAGGFLFVSGMLPGPLLAGETEGFERQARAALGHCRQVVEAAGYAMTDVVQSTVYIAGIEYWRGFNDIYASVFGEHRPARAIVPVPELHHGYLVEIQMVAFKG
jgi:2-iminobutanoate/2-iminopropanoate deaminase